MKLPQFLIVGLLGTVTNLVLFYFLVDKLSYPPIPISVLAFLLASMQNYLLNHFWTFNKSVGNKFPKILDYFRFLSVSLIGLSVNLFILWWYINTFDPSIKVVAQAIGIAGGTSINFLGSKYWVFK